MKNNPEQLSQSLLPYIYLPIQSLNKFFHLSQVVLDLRVLDDGPEEVLRHLDSARRDDGSKVGQELHLSDHSRNPFLPSTSRSSSRSEAAELVDRQERRHQDCRLRPRKGLRNPRQGLHSRGKFLIFCQKKKMFLRKFIEIQTTALRSDDKVCQI